MERADRDPLAARAALQVVLPTVQGLISGVREWDTEERTATVIAETLEVLDRCAHVAAGTAPHFRVYANTRRRVLRAASRDRKAPVTPVGDLAAVPDPSTPGERPSDEAIELAELIDWVTGRGGVGEGPAREVVLTRAGGVEVDELARALDVTPGALRERRRRTEQRLRRSLGIER